MKSVSVRACGAALLVLLVAVTAVPVFADNPPPGTVAPQTRIQPPVGVTAGEAPQGRIAPPVGVASEAEESPSAWELFLVWLQHRIQPPVG